MILIPPVEVGVSDPREGLQSTPYQSKWIASLSKYTEGCPRRTAVEKSGCLLNPKQTRAWDSTSDRT